MRMQLTLTSYEYAKAACEAAGLTVDSPQPANENYRSAILWRNGYHVGSIATTPGCFSQEVVLLLDSHRNTTAVFTAVFRHLETIGGML